MAKGEFKGDSKGKEGDKGKQGPKGPTLPAPKASGSKCARISEEPPEVVEGNSNKMHDNGAMTEDGMKPLSRIRMLKVPAVCSEVFRLSPTPATLRHCFQRCSQDCQQPTSGMKTGRMPPSTMKRSISMCHSLHGSRIHITGHARFSKRAVLPKSPSPTMTLL